MSSPTAQREILTQAVEDWTGLWEALWGLHNILPEKGEQEIHDLAEETLKELMDKGWITLVYFNELSNQSKPISGEKQGAILRDRKSWKPPDRLGETHVRFIATEAGKSAWIGEKV